VSTLASALSLLRLGVDIGGSGIKCALVDLETGELASERMREPTPQPATPAAVTAATAELVRRAGHTGPVGIGLPSVVNRGIVETASNIDDSWLGTDAPEAFVEAVCRPVAVINDADAAALCEARFGAARGVSGLVIVLTFGSGIGSGFLFNGDLIPNTELGAMQFGGHMRAETGYSAQTREREGLTFEEWGARASRFLCHVRDVFRPELVVVGGGVAREWDQWSGSLDESLRVVPASRANNAGIIGAATLVA